MKFPVFDLHCDTALALLGGEASGCSMRENNLHIDLNRAGELPGYAQCFACFTSTPDALPLAISPCELFQQEYNVIKDSFVENIQIIRQAFHGEDIIENQKNGIMSGILTIEGTAGIAFDHNRLSELYAQGFRISTLGWNEKNPLAGSHMTGGGLTDLGRAYVKEAQRVGILIDVSHVSDEAFWDIMQITTAPVIATHSNSRSICNVSRNLTDNMFLAICRTGGVVGINLYTEFLGENADLQTVCGHILHFLSLDPTGTHIALGGDLDGCESLPAGFRGVQDYAKLAESLQSAGLSDETVYNIFWNNAVNLLKSSQK